MHVPSLTNGCVQDIESFSSRSISDRHLTSLNFFLWHAAMSQQDNKETQQRHNELITQ